MEKRAIQILSLLLLIATLLCGTIFFFQYLGVTYHASVLLPRAVLDTMQTGQCNGSAWQLFLCGTQSLFSFLDYTFSRAAPFLGYTIFSVVLLLVLCGWQALSIGEATGWRLRIRPLYVLLLVFLLLWTLFTFMSFLPGDPIAMQQIVEPTANVYPGASATVLQSLRSNFDALQAQGCLAQTEYTLADAHVFTYSTACVHIAFFTRVFPQVLFVLLLLFEFLVLGRIVLRWIRSPSLPALTTIVLTAGVGACAWIVLLWTLAVLHIIVAPVVWALALLVPAIGYRSSLYWIRKLWEPGEECVYGWFSPRLLLLWLLVSYLLLNFLVVVRPFPIGWDDLGSYLNRPRLMVSYGSFIFSMSPFQWEYLTSLGFLLFGYQSTFGATASMMVNWTEGLLAIGAILAFSELFLGKERGVLAALLYYSLPLVGHFSFADMKIDNAVFAMGALATLLVFLALFPRVEQDEPPPLSDRLRWLILAGVLAGFGFAMKPTVIMVFLSLAAVIAGVSLHWTAFLGAIFFAFAVFVYQGVLSVSQVLGRIFGSISISNTAALLPLIVLGVLCIVIALIRRPGAWRATILSLAVFGMGFLAAIAPWIIHNNIQRGKIIPSLEFGAPNPYSPLFDVSGSVAKEPGRPYRALPTDLQVSRSQAACGATGSTEELDRYWGFRTGWTHYLTLPWRTVMNIDSQGYYVTTAFIFLLFPLLLLLPFFWMKRGRWLKWLTCGTGLLLLEWMVLGNGIPWYGIGIFLGLVIGIEALLARAPDPINRVTILVFIVLSLLISFANRFWQFEMQRNLFEYPMGKISASALLERTVAHYDDIAGTAVELSKRNTARPYLYRIGTFIPYFIPRNLEILGVTDNQLDFFNCLFAERDPEKTLKRLQALGFHSIIFDTNTATIEKNPQGSLHEKVKAFLEFVNTRSLGLQAVVNDPDGGVAYIILP